MLRALAEEELVAFNADTKRYTLEAGVLTLARGWLRRNRFADLVQPVLDRLAREYGVTMLGVQVVGLEHMIVIATTLGGSNFQLSAQVGSRFPALISATGRCIAAFGEHSEAAIRKRFDALRWDEPPGFELWSQQVAQTRERGWAIDDGNYIAGVTVLAAPVWKAPGTPGHALVAVGLASSVRRVGAGQLAAALTTGARADRADIRHLSWRIIAPPMPLAIAAAWGAPHSLAGSGRSRIAIEHNLAELAPIGPLSDWLDAHVPELDTGPLQTAILSSGTSNVVLTLDRGDRKMVLRRPPTIPPPGAEKGVLREARILTALNATAVPHPHCYAACEDTGVLGAPFYVMELVDG